MAAKFSKKADVEAGLFFSIFGAITAVLSLQYRMGTIAMIGPGMFPLALGIILTILGLVILVKGLLGGGEDSRSLPLKPTILVAISPLVFAVLLLSVGLVAAIPGLVVVSLWASAHFTWTRAAMLSAGLLAFCYVVFVEFLGVAIPMIAV